MKKAQMIQFIHENINECPRDIRLKVLSLIYNNKIPIQEKATGCSIRYSKLKKNTLKDIHDLIHGYFASLEEKQ